MSDRRLRLVVLLTAVMVLLAGCATDLGDVGSAPDGVVSGDGLTPPGDAKNPNGTLVVHYLNVGQGDSTLVVGPTGETILVDTGGFRDDGELVLRYLRRHGVSRIDVLVTTHADADHIGGHATLIEYYETEADGVGAVYDPGFVSASRTYADYLDAVERHDVPLYLTQVDDEIPLNGANVTVLAPPESALGGGDRNENSIVLRITFGATSFLLTGDAGTEEERYVVERFGDRLDVTALKAGHHGSRTSSTDALLRAADPQLVVVSSDFDSQYGHPHIETLRRIADRNVPTYWTAVHGSVVVASDGRRVAVATQFDATTDPLQLRTERAVEPGSDEPLASRTTYPADGESVTGGPSDAADAWAGEIVVAEIHADAAGDDRANLNDEFVVIENRGTDPISLGGWTVRDSSGATYVFPSDAVLEPGATVTLRTGDGTDTRTDRYWNAGRAVWNNDGDTVTVVAADGRVVVEVSY